MCCTATSSTPLWMQERTYVIVQVQAIEDAFPNGVHLLAACDSDAGNVRRSEPNEDSTLLLMLQRVHESQSIPSGVFIVADGMGGHDNGQGGQSPGDQYYRGTHGARTLAGPAGSGTEGQKRCKPFGRRCTGFAAARLPWKMPMPLSAK